MARPKLGDGESERLQMVITTGELEAIEEWRYRNRVPSKSEAIRRLCAVALVALNGVDKLKQMAEDASASALDDHEHIGGHFRGLLQDSVDGNQHGFTYTEAKDLLHDYSNRAYWQDQNTRHLNRIISGLSDALNMFAEPQSFMAAEQNANERLSELDAFIELQHVTWDLMGASHARSAVLRLMTDTERSHLDSLEDHEERIEFLDQKVSKYLASRKRRRKRLIDKIRKEDERIRQAALARFRNSGDGDGSEDGE